MQKPEITKNIITAAGPQKKQSNVAPIIL